MVIASVMANFARPGMSAQLTPTKINPAMLSSAPPEYSAILMLRSLNSHWSKGTAGAGGAAGALAAARGAGCTACVAATTEASNGAATVRAGVTASAAT